MRPLLLSALLLLGAGCGYVSFARKETTDEVVLKQQIMSYYDSVKAAFASGAVQRFAVLFDPKVANPMTHAQIMDWAQKFLGKHGRAAFRVNKLDIEQLGFSQAVVVLDYSVETPSGEGGFSGLERDWLVKKRGRWMITRWEKLSR
jgi:hypothetical protein